MSRVKLFTKKRFLLLLAIFCLAVFCTWFLIRLVTIDTNLVLHDEYKFPETNSLSNLYELKDGDFAIAIDGLVVAGKNIGDNKPEIRPTASTAKMILGLAVMNARPFSPGERGDTFTVSEDDFAKYLWYINHGGSYVSVNVGEEITEYDALMAVFLASANNIADSLAIWVFGSIDNYRIEAAKMLAKWGIENTNIGEDASGFSETTTSTASDLAIIGQKVLENPVLKKIVGTKSYTIPMMGTIDNTNKILGTSDVIGIKTGYIGEVSGYCLISGYEKDGHIVTLALLNTPSREASFGESLAIINELQRSTAARTLVNDGDIVGYYESWWTGKIPIRAKDKLDEMIFAEAQASHELNMNEDDGNLKFKINNNMYSVRVEADEYIKKPSVLERIKHIFGWKKEASDYSDAKTETDTVAAAAEEEVINEEKSAETEQTNNDEVALAPITNAASNNCTIKFGNLMLINPNFMVENEFIAARRSDLISLSQTYGIVEGNSYNGDNLLDAEAASHINDMIKAYEAEYPGHTFETFSCFRAVGTKCGRLCAATGASDHHTGLTCDLVDPSYGASLDTDTYEQHIDWQWLKANSYKYGFIDRFPEAWAGGPMSEPLNVDENGSTGLFETWHYRYVGVSAATEIATGKYNNGEYDSLEHYLKMLGLVSDLKAGTCYNR